MEPPFSTASDLPAPWIPPYEFNLLTQKVQAKDHSVSIATMEACMIQKSSIPPRHTPYRISTALDCSVSANHLTDGPSRELHHFEQISRIKSKRGENDRFLISGVLTSLDKAGRALVANL